MNNNKIDELEKKLYELKYQRRWCAIYSIGFAIFCGNDIGSMMNTDNESQKVVNMILALLYGGYAFYNANVVKNDTLEIYNIKEQQKVLTKENDSHK